MGNSAFLGRGGKTVPLVKAGGLADMVASLFDAAWEVGYDVHIAMPHFRRIIGSQSRARSPHLHLCEDREFYYRKAVYEGDASAGARASIAFQKDVIHYILPSLRPDLVHCHDWMTGLIPGAARKLGIPSLFTVHNFHDHECTLAHIEERGLDAARFWDELYYHGYPGNYEHTRDSNPVSFLASGILAADRMNTVSTGFLGELAGGLQGVGWPVVDAVRGKLAAGHARGILNSLPKDMSPDMDPALPKSYDAADHAAGKLMNKVEFQKRNGLQVEPDAALMFWPSRLDPVQKGCDLLAGILRDILTDYADIPLQIALVADGPGKGVFEELAGSGPFAGRLSVSSFKEDLSRLGYAASDFTLMPSSYEPCGLAQLLGMRYGSLPIVHATGGLRDTVRGLDAGANNGNGFIFENFDPGALRWAIDQALLFHRLPDEVKHPVLARVMLEAKADFAISKMATGYFELYRSILESYSHSPTLD